MPLAFEGVRAIARLAIAGFTKEGLTANAIIRQLGNLSLTYRRTTMLLDIREFSGLMRLESAVRNIPWNVVMPRYGMVETYLRRARRYRVFGIATRTDPRTGEEEEKPVSFYTNTRGSKNDWYDSFMEEYQGSESEGAWLFTDFEVTSVEHQKGWKY